MRSARVCVMGVAMTVTVRMRRTVRIWVVIVGMRMTRVMRMRMTRVMSVAFCLVISMFVAVGSAAVVVTPL
jgi:hypothetical protein